MHETITTSRLTLRPVRLDDAPAVFDRYAADPEVTRFLQWRPQPNVEAVRDFLRRCEVESAAGREHSWVLAVIELALGALRRYRVSAYTDYDNARSARVMEKARHAVRGPLAPLRRAPQPRE